MRTLDRTGTMKLSDETWMQLALRMGRRHMGATAENPSVGCIIVKDGTIAGRGVTGRGGRPHAETEALAEAGARAEGADVFVTLEPCANHGQTGPCCEALAAAGIKRVVSALEDPDPRTRGAGHLFLKDSGVEVVTGVCSDDARSDLAGFISRIERGRPHVTLKLAVSADGMIAEAPGRQTAITGEQALRRSHMMRAEADAIMVGANTVRTDNPSLTCRLPGLEDRSPLRIVVSQDPDLLAGTTLKLTEDEVPVWQMHGKLEAILRQLAERGVGRLLVEGGAILAGALLEQSLVDEVALFQASHELGSGGVRAPIELIQSDNFTAQTVVSVGDDVLTLYDRVQHGR